MFGSLGKQFAGDIASQVQSAVSQHLEKKSREKGSTEKATEALGQVTGRRKALFIGINYFGQNGELKGKQARSHPHPRLARTYLLT